MKIYRGKSVCAGIAIGKIYVYQKGRQSVTRYQVENADAEVMRFREALGRAEAQLSHFYEEAAHQVGEADAAIFSGYQMILHDREYLESIEGRIRGRSVNAEYAVATISDNYVAMFSSLEDEYMQTKAVDVRDVSERILEALSDSPGGKARLEEPVIVVAQDLAPSETIQLDRKKVLSFVTLGGSPTSHTAILARSMGIPALVGLASHITEGAEKWEGLKSLHGKLAVVDGNTGVLMVEPDEATILYMRQLQEREQAQRALLLSMKGKKSVTLDGRHVPVCANVGNRGGLEQTLENDAEGIGLFRSEYLYLEKDTYPTEQEQFEIYKMVLEKMGDRRVIIRTLDVGADKQADYFALVNEENPAMGLRGIRVSLTWPEVFKVQLRALLRAGAFGRLAIMYPMITSVKEVRQIHTLVEEIKRDLQTEGIPYGNVEQGIMIETPAAAVTSDLLAKEVDFFSIGTNDLSQYGMAIDRQNPQLEDFYDPYHPAILRMIAQTIQNAHRAGIWCGICGELGADLELTELFLAMGVDELSVSPVSVLPLRSRIRQISVKECREEVLRKWLQE